MGLFRFQMAFSWLLIGSDPNYLLSGMTLMTLQVIVPSPNCSWNVPIFPFVGWCQKQPGFTTGSFEKSTHHVAAWKTWNSKCPKRDLVNSCIFIMILCIAAPCLLEDFHVVWRPQWFCSLAVTSAVHRMDNTLCRQKQTWRSSIVNRHHFPPTDHQ